MGSIGYILIGLLKRKFVIVVLTPSGFYCYHCFCRFLVTLVSIRSYLSSSILPKQKKESVQKRALLLFRTERGYECSIIFFDNFFCKYFMKKSKESLRKKVDVFVMTRIGRLLVNRGERPKGPKVVIIIILSITGVVRSIKNRKQIIAKYWDVSDLRQLKDCQFGLNLFWGNGTSWETNGKMYLFAFFGVDLKFAVSIWAYFPLNHHSIQQTALHTPQTLVRNLQDYLIFSSSLALIFDQLELSCQTQLHGSKLKKWIEANLINWVYITTNHILLMLKGIVETKKENLMLWHFLHKASMHLKARPRKHFILWDFCCDTSLCWRPQKICLFSSFWRDFVQCKI